MRVSKYALVLLALLFLVTPDLPASGRRRSSSSMPIVKVEGVVLRFEQNVLTVRTARRDVDVEVPSGVVVVVDERRGAVSDVKAGDLVEILALRETDGRLTALLVEVKSDDEEIAGIISAVSPESLTVKADGADVLIALTTDTRFIVGGHSATASDLRAGQRVFVRALRHSDGSLVAIAVIAVEQQAQTAEGTITAASDTSITIRGERGQEKTFAITPATEITSDGRPFPVSLLRVGAEVKVKYMTDAAGSATALLIRVENEEDLRELSGSIEAVTDLGLKLRTRDGDAVDVQILSDTVIRSHGNVISRSDLKAGDRVEIKGRADGNVFVAVRIEVEDHRNDDRSTEIEGTITEVSGSSLTVADRKGGEQTATIDSSTVIKRDGRVIEASALRVKDRVEVKARRDTDGTLIAVTIKVEDGGEDEDDD